VLYYLSEHLHKRFAGNACIFQVLLASQTRLGIVIPQTLLMTIVSKMFLKFIYFILSTLQILSDLLIYI